MALFVLRGIVLKNTVMAETISNTSESEDEEYAQLEKSLLELMKEVVAVRNTTNS